MRLPESITAIAPVGAVLTAQEAGQARLIQEAERHMARLLVEAADAQGLSLWEGDYGLPDWSAAAAELRRLRLRGAMAGGQTLTRQRLKALVIRMTGAQEVLIREDFAACCVEIETAGGSALPDAAAIAALEAALQRQKPAHLQIHLLCGAALEALRQDALWGRMLCVLTGEIQETA